VASSLLSRIVVPFPLVSRWRNGELDRIEKEMPKAMPEVQWTMNNTLAAIGIRHTKHRKRAIAIGELLGLYRDWPVSKGCTPPYVPVWVEAMVKRQG
jgi:hypothetical protein